jgi:hypothetical protein
MLNWRKGRSTGVLCLAGLAAALLALSACTDDDGAGLPRQEDFTPEAQAGFTPRPMELLLRVFDNYFFATKLGLLAGQHVTITVWNQGLDTHNLRFAGPDGLFETEDDVVTDPDAIITTKIGTLRWDVPPGDDEFPFRCDFHPEEGTGTVLIEDVGARKATPQPTPSPPATQTP